MEKKIMRTKQNQWCEVTVKLTDGEKGCRLSITGMAGEIMTCRDAKRYSREYWESFFEDSPDEIRAMNERCGTNFRSPVSAAKYVLNCDGDYHGLDVHSEKGNKVFSVFSCGKIRDEIGEYFPEIMPFFEYHLNDMTPSENGERWDYRPIPIAVLAELFVLLAS